jgi:site-specific recombinase XerD
MDRRPLSPELEQLLSDYQHYLEQWSYSNAPYRLSVARDFLHWWPSPLPELTCSDWQSYARQGPGSRDHAVTAFRKFLRETGHWMPPPPDPPEVRPLEGWPPVTAAAVQGFLAFRKRQGQSVEERTDDRTRLVWFLETLPPEGRADLNQVSHRHVAAYIEAMQDRELAPATINRRLATVQTFFRWLSREGHYAHDNPVREDHRLFLPLSLPRALPAQDVRAFLAMVEDVCLRALFLVLLRTGLRLGEALALTVADVNLPEATLTIRCGGKNGRGRIVYLAEDAGQALEKWLQARQGYPVKHLFFSFQSHSMSQGYVYQRFQGYLEEAGITRHYRVHDLRHTFATDLLNAGVPLTTLQELMGHTNLIITQRYAHVADPTKRGQYFAAMNQLAQEGQLWLPHVPEESHAPTTR